MEQVGLGDVWPLGRLRLALGDVVLRPASDEDAVRFGEIIHTLLPPEQRHYMPNLHIGVLRDTVAETARQELNWIWSRRAAFGPDDWSLIFAVVLDGEVIGMQDIHATEFPVTRTINSGSFLRADMRGRGIGVRMRAMVLELAFEHLGARLAKSGYMPGNDASRRVSEQCGYEPDGFGGPYVYEGEAYEDFAVRLTAERWAAHRPDWLDDLQITGLEPCLEIMGLQP